MSNSKSKFVHGGNCVSVCVWQRGLVSASTTTGKGHATATNHVPPCRVSVTTADSNGLKVDRLKGLTA